MVDNLLFLYLQMSSVYFAPMDVIISTLIHVIWMIQTVRAMPPKSLIVLRSYASFVLLTLVCNSVFLARWSLAHKSLWKTLTAWLTLFTLSPCVLDLMGLIPAAEWIGLTYFHLLGPSSHRHPFNSDWAKDFLLARMMGSYWMAIFIRCPFLSPPLLTIGRFAMIQGGWFWLSSSSDISSQNHTLILHPSSALVTPMSPILGYCQMEPIATFVMEPVTAFLTTVVFQICFLLK